MAEVPYSPLAVGKRLRHLRKAHGMTQSEFSSKCDVSVPALSNWERGRQRPSIEHAQNIVDQFDVTLDYLFLGRTYMLKYCVAVFLGKASES